MVVPPFQPPCGLVTPYRATPGHRAVSSRPRHYGRLDGLPILLRVVHVVQVKLTNRCLVAHRKTTGCKRIGMIGMIGAQMKVKAQDFEKEIQGNSNANKSAVERHLPAAGTALQGVCSRK